MARKSPKPKDIMAIPCSRKEMMVIVQYIKDMDKRVEELEKEALDSNTLIKKIKKRHTALENQFQEGGKINWKEFDL